MTSAHKNLSRRQFLLGSAATVAGATTAVSGISLFSDRAQAFINAGAFWKKPSGNGQTSNGYTIGQSLRFTPANMTYLSRTPAAAGNSNLWTVSFWYKKSSNYAGADVYVFQTTGQNTVFYFSGGGYTEDSFRISMAGVGKLYTSRTLRDPSSWYHFVVACDLANGTASSKIRLFINGLEETAFAYDARSSLGSGSSNINTVVQHTIGCAASTTINGYVAEFRLIDGFALDATNFGELDTNTGQWIPKSFSGAYGTNGFYLKFADASNTTAATLGKDSSPNGNNWTPTSFNIHDQVLDSPTNNFCTFNPIAEPYGTVFANGALQSTCPGGTYPYAIGTIGVNSGKFYWETTVTASPASDPWNQVGVASQPTTGTSNYLGSNTSTLAYSNGANSTGRWYTNATSTAYGAIFGTGDVIGTALDLVSATPTITFYKNGASQGAINLPASLQGVALFPAAADWTAAGSGIYTLNCGQGGQTGLTYNSASGGRFKYTPPAGFKALCAVNMAVPSIIKPAQNFVACATTGSNIASTLTAALNVTGYLELLKNRTSATNWQWHDTVRGVANSLSSSALDGSNHALAEAAFSAPSGTDNFVGFRWKAGTTVTNTTGSISVQLSANPTAGFSIATYSGNSTSGATIGHGLGVAPSFVTIKSRTLADNWGVYHKSLGATQILVMQLTQAAMAHSAYWNNTAPTSSVFTLGNDTAVNYSGHTYVAYLWAEVAGFSKFGSYTGNGSANGPFVHCGFKPKYVLVKRTDTSGYNWTAVDSARTSFNPSDQRIFPNDPSQELTGETIDLLSNGFKCRTGTNTDFNAANATYIFAAFAEAPFKYATAR